MERRFADDLANKANQIRQSNETISNNQQRIVELKQLISDNAKQFNSELAKKDKTISKLKEELTHNNERIVTLQDSFKQQLEKEAEERRKMQAIIDRNNLLMENMGEVLKNYEKQDEPSAESKRLKTSGSKLMSDNASEKGPGVSKELVNASEAAIRDESKKRPETPKKTVRQVSNNENSLSDEMRKKFTLKPLLGFKTHVDMKSQVRNFVCLLFYLLTLNFNWV